MTNPADIARALSEDDEQPIGVAYKAMLDRGGVFQSTMNGHGIHISAKVEWQDAKTLARLLVFLSEFMPDNPLPRPTASDASTDRTPATVDGCGRKVEL